MVLLSCLTIKRTVKHKKRSAFVGGIMKKFLTIVSIVLLFVAMTLSMVACSKTETVTLTLYDNDGTTVLSTQKVEKGKTPTMPEAPKKDGFTFKGWFVTPTSTKAFDFDAPMKEDAKAYAQWQDNSFVDTRDWVISGTMNNWGKNLATNYHMTKVAEKNNVFELTIDLRVGDQFKLTVLLDTGILDYNNADGARASSKHLVGAGEYMEGNGGLGDEKNIEVKKEGNYTLTLTTDSNTDNNRLTVKRNGDAKPVETQEVVNYYIKGSGITNWANIFSPATRFIVGTDGKYTLKVQLKANEEFLFMGVVTNGETEELNGQYFNITHVDEASLELFTAKTDENGNLVGNIKTREAGTYEFVLDPENKTISATKSAVDTTEYNYFIDGTILGGNWGAYMKAEDKTAYKLTKDGDVYTIENVVLNKDEELVVRAHEASVETLAWENVAFAYNSEYLVGSVGFSAVDKNNLNVKVGESGTYNITFNSYSKILTIAKLGKDVFVKGTMNSWEHEFRDEFKMTANSENTDVYEITLTFAKDAEFGLDVYNIGAQEGGVWVGKANLGTTGDANATFTVEGKGNLCCSEAGEYRITYNYKTGIIDIYKVQATA